MANEIMIIHPYKHDDWWVFDDEKVGLIKEPFVSGADDIIDLMVSNLEDANNGFNLVFSGNPFPGFQYSFDRRREEFGGWWYWSEEHQLSGWLCPALFKYFEIAPLSLFIQVSPKKIPGNIE